jgi:hypothetical protein
MENILINVDSRFRNTDLYPNSGKFTLKLNQTIKDILYIRLSSTEIPNLYYTFSQTKNNVSFTVTVGIATTIVTIIDGFYDSTQLLKIIQDKLPAGMTITLNLINGITTLSHTAAFSVNFTNTGNNKSLGYHLGFLRNTYSSTLNNVTNRHELVGDSLLDNIGDNYLFLRINDYGKMYNFNKSTSDYNETLDNYLGKIILSVGKAEKNFDNNNFITKKHIFRQPTNISKLDIELIEPTGNVINTNAMDYSFTLELGVIYDRELYKASLNTFNYNSSIITI